MYLVIAARDSNRILYECNHLKQETEFFMEVCDHISCDSQENSDDVDNHVTLPLPQTSQYPSSQDRS